METLNKYRTYIMAGIVVVGLSALAVFGDTPAEAPVVTKSEHAHIAAATDTKSSPKKSVVYSYVAQPGDSYTVLARKAVQTYGIINKAKLSLAQIIAAETTLTQDAGSPVLNEGQKITIDTATVKSAIDAARKLSSTDLAAWQTYVSSVDFNTNKAGQKS